jgi:hypothetical protein
VSLPPALATTLSRSHPTCRLLPEGVSPARKIQLLPHPFQHACDALLPLGVGVLQLAHHCCRLHLSRRRNGRCARSIPLEAVAYRLKPRHYNRRAGGVRRGACGTRTAARRCGGALRGDHCLAISAAIGEVRVRSACPSVRVRVAVAQENVTVPRPRLQRARGAREALHPAGLKVLSSTAAKYIFHSFSLILPSHLYPIWSNELHRS